MNDNKVKTTITPFWEYSWLPAKETEPEAQTPRTDAEIAGVARKTALQIFGYKTEADLRYWDGVQQDKTVSLAATAIEIALRHYARELRGELNAAHGVIVRLREALIDCGNDADQLDSCLLRLLNEEDCRGEANGKINHHAAAHTRRMQVLAETSVDNLATNHSPIHSPPFAIREQRTP